MKMQRRELDPAECSDKQLTQFLNQMRTIVPKTRSDKIIAATRTLRSQGRNKILTVEPASGTIDNVVQSLTQIFSSSLSPFVKTKKPDPIYESIHSEQSLSPPKIKPSQIRQREKYDYNLGYQSFSPIQPVPNNHPEVQETPGYYSTDSLDRESHRNFGHQNYPEQFIYPGNTDNNQKPRLPPKRVIRHQPVKYNDAFAASPQEISREKQPELYQNMKHVAPLLPVKTDFLRQKPEVTVDKAVSPIPQNSNNSKPQRNLMSHLKFRHVFSIGETDVQDYLSAVERFCNMQGIEGGNIVLMALQYFKSAAESNLVQDSLSDEEILNWDLFKSKLVSEYGLTKRDWFAKFENHVRGNKESCSELLNKLSIFFKNAVSKKTLSQDNRETIMRRFKKCLNPLLASHLEAKEINNFATIAQEAQRLERAYSIPRVKPLSIISNVESKKNDYPVCDSSRLIQNQRPGKPGFSNERVCHVCDSRTHNTKYCYFNAMSTNYKGDNWVRSQKMTPNSNNSGN